MIDLKAGLPVVGILLCYSLFYATRNLLTSASAHLLHTNTINRNVYAISQTTAYGLIFIAKILSGPVLDLFTKYNHLLAFFGSLPLLNSMLLCALGGTALIRSVSHASVSATFAVVYCFGKLTFAFARVAVLQLYQMRHDPSAIAMARVSTASQVLAGVGDGIGKLTIGALMRKFGEWQRPLIVVASGALVPILISTALLFDTSDHGAKKNDTGPTRAKGFHHCFSLLKKLPVFICLIISMIDSLVAVMFGTYASHFLKFGLGIESAKATMIDGVSPILVPFTIAAGGILMTKFSESRYRVFGLILMPYAILNFGGLLALSNLINFSSPPDITVATILLTVHHLAFHFTRSLIDGAFLTLLVGSSDAPAATGLISGFGYLSTLVVPFWIKNHSMSVEGWQYISRSAVALQAASLFFIIILAIYEYKK